MLAAHLDDLRVTESADRFSLAVKLPSRESSGDTSQLGASERPRYFPAAHLASFACVFARARIRSRAKLTCAPCTQKAQGDLGPFRNSRLWVIWRVLRLTFRPTAWLGNGATAIAKGPERCERPESNTRPFVVKRVSVIRKNLGPVFDRLTRRGAGGRRADKVWKWLVNV